MIGKVVDIFVYNDEMGFKVLVNNKLITIFTKKQEYNFKINDLVVVKKDNKLYTINQYFGEKKTLLTWDDWYLLATKYFLYHGDLNVPCDFKTDNGFEYKKNGKYKLGSWISYERVIYQKYENKNIPPLIANRFKLLNDIKMIWNVFDNRWQIMYKLAQKYYEYHGNLDVSHNFKTDNGFEYKKDGKYNLGIWISTQRNAYQNHKLTSVEIELLNKIGMIWSINDKRWNEYYNLAKIYFLKHGNLNIPTNFKTDNGYEYKENGKYKLGAWIKTQRSAFQNRYIKEEERTNNIAPLTDEKVKLLESIGMIWNIKQNKRKLKEICNSYNLDYQKYKELINNMSYQELIAKINYLKINNFEIEINNNLHPIFFMSSARLIETINLSLEELIREYGINISYSLKR